MIKWTVLVATLLAWSSSPAFDSAYFQLSEPEIHQGQTVELSHQAFSNVVMGSSLCSSSNSRVLGWNAGLQTSDAIAVAEVVKDLEGGGIVFDQVVNFGKKVWKVIEAGKPVVNLRTDVATALPLGVKCWLDLQTWKAPQATTFTVVYKNPYGIEVVKFSYRVISISGGSVNGRGAYIGYAAVEPSDVQVAWGFNLSAEGLVQHTFNMGTQEAPVAGLNLQLNYTIKTVLQENRVSRSYFVNGHGDFRALD
jgi:hypothetical protein